MKAFEKHRGKKFDSVQNFLHFFRDHGFYLDDLCLYPINHMREADKPDQRNQNIDGLAKRITSYDPKAIVVVVKGIAGHVERAVELSGIAPINTSVLPFPRKKYRYHYVEGLAMLLPDLLDSA